MLVTVMDAPPTRDETGDPWTTRGGVGVMIRPIAGDDEEGMARFHRSLSPETVYTRYFNVAKLSVRTAPARLDRVCHPAPDDETVLVVETATAAASGRRIVGVGRLSVLPGGGGAAEVAFLVCDSFQRQGLGSELLRRLVEAAGRRGLRHLRAHLLPGNVAMRALCLRAGMRLAGGLEEQEIRAEIDL
ncbi:MAG: CoA-binding domain protein [Phycisphaerales bacterium]|nr:CoA-binding domain protein [Phycisphaerales bacterium]